MTRTAAGSPRLASSFRPPSDGTIFEPVDVDAPAVPRPDEVEGEDVGPFVLDDEHPP
jgi:hypothetical protein